MLRCTDQCELAAYRARYEGADVVLFEPQRDDYTMFFVNVFSFSSRRRVLEHAYRSTLHQLAARREELGPVLARRLAAHGAGWPASRLPIPLPGCPCPRRGTRSPNWPGP